MVYIDTDPTLPSDQEALLARQASRMLAERTAVDGALRVLVVETGREAVALHLPGPAARLLETMLEEMGKGRAVTLVPIDAEVTTQQAANLLNVSRPYVVGLIEQGVLPARMIGPRRCIPLKELLTYRTEIKARAYAGLREIVAIDQELGL